MKETRAKILIIDDSETDRQIMARLLSQKRWDNLIFARNAREGYDKALSEKPQVVIMDTVLPDKDGFTLCRALTENNELACYKILLTGHVDAIDTERASKAGADKYIVKTTKYEMLLAALEKLIDDNSNAG